MTTLKITVPKTAKGEDVKHYIDGEWIEDLYYDSGNHVVYVRIKDEPSLWEKVKAKLSDKLEIKDWNTHAETLPK